MTFAPLTVADLERLHVLEPAQCRALPAFDDARRLVGDLVGRGWLTLFQAERLLAGEGESLVLGSYVLLDRLGEGGMGAVFKARHWKLGSVVALKVIRPEKLTSPAAAARFLREIRAAAALQHPHIVQARDAEQVGATLALVMDHVEGIDLSTLVKQHGPLPIALACACIRQTALGLQHAFEKGFVHRDIKPSNLMLASGRREPHPAAYAAGSPGDARPLLGAMVKILDFGLARQEDGGDGTTLTQEGSIIGTPDFMAPEQTLDARRVDTRADLYALGGTFHFLLTRRPPFPGGSLGQKIARHQSLPPTPVQELRPEVPGSVAAIVQCLLAKRPEDRFQTPAELVQALDLAIADLAPPPEAVSGNSPPPVATEVNHFTSLAGDAPTASASAAMQRPRRIWGFAAAGGLLVLLLLLLWQPWRTGPPPAGRESLTVEANRPWQDSGIDVEAGEEISVRAHGEWQRKGLSACGPAGRASVSRGRAVLADAPAMCLIGRIADTVFPLGMTASIIQVPCAGRLFLQANELLLEDAGGSLLVEIDGGTAATQDAIAPALLPIQQAELDLLPLAHRLDLRTEEPRQLRGELLKFVRTHAGTPAASRASGLLRALPSPLDGLDGSQVPAWAIPGPSVPALVALAGDPRGRHRAAIGILHWREDGTILAGDFEGKVWQWQAGDLTARRTVQGPAVSAVHAIASDGRRILSVSVLGVAPPRLWNVETGKTLLSFKPAANNQGISWTGGRRALTWAGSSLVSWNVETGESSSRNFMKTVRAAILSPDNQRILLTLSPTEVKLLQTDDLNKVCELKGAGSQLTRPVWSPDGKRVAAPGSDGEKGSVWVWDAETGRLLLTLRADLGHVQTACFSPDGTRLLAGDNHGWLALWNAVTGELQGKAQQDSGYANVLTFSPDGRQAASGQTDHSVRVWDLPGRTLKETLPRQGHAGTPTAIAFTPHGASLLSADNEGGLSLWDLSGTAPVLKAHCVNNQASYSIGLVVDPEGRFVIAGLASGCYGRFALEDSSLRSLTRLNYHLHRSRGVYRLPGGRAFAVHHDPGLHLISEEDGFRSARRLCPCAPEVVQSPDGRTLAWVEDRTMVRLFDPMRPGESRTLPTGCPETIHDISFTPEGRSLVLCAGKEAGLYQLALSGKEVARRLSIHGDAAEKPRLAVSPDGRLVAVGSATGRVRVYRLSDGGIELACVLPWAVGRLAFAPDSRHLALTGSNGCVGILRLASPSSP